MRPVPGPVTRAGGAPVMAAVTALAAVVLPMPRSPVAIRSAPAAAASAASAAPAATQCCACSRVIAGPRLRSAVPCPARTERSSGWRGSSPPASPASTAMRRTPSRRAMTLTAAPPARTLRTICAVTACG